MFEGMFRNDIAMWIFVGIFAITIFMLFIIVLKELGIISYIKEKYSEYRKNRDFWDFNPVTLIFGGLFILFFFLIDAVKEWFIRHKYQIIMSIIHFAFLFPLALALGGIIQLPEFYFPFFLFYLIGSMMAFVARADTKNHQKHGDGRGNDYGYSYDNYPNKTHKYHPPTYVKPKPTGLSKEEVEKKKKKIREKIIENKELKKKYNL